MASVRVRTATGLFFCALVVAGLYGAELARPGLEPWCLGFLVGLLAAFEAGRMGKLAAPGRVLLLPLLVGSSGLALLFVLLRGPTPWESVLWLVGIQAAAVVVGTAVGHAAPAPMAHDGAPSFLHGRGALGILAAWIGPPLAGLGLVHVSYGTAVLAALIVLSKIGDVAGYFVGKSIGKSHPFPKLSPGKTSAGCVASLIAGSAAGVGAAALELLPGSPGLLTGALVGALLNVSAQAADLFESYVKRTAGVKDSSGMAGASGGVLDLVDSILFTVPVSLLLFALLTI